MKKGSKLELITGFITAVTIAFACGWFLRGSLAPQSIRVETERTLSAAEDIPLVLPAPTEEGKTLLSINTASAEELETLPGIGPKRAADIVAYREANGPFRIPEDITKVSGIGESILEGLLEFITVE